jgi:hypothetical protein
MSVRHQAFHSRDQDELMDPVEEVHHEPKIAFYKPITLFMREANHLKNA